MLINLSRILRTADDGANGGGGERTFTEADVTRIVQERVGKLKSQLDAATAALGELDGIKAKLAAADQERQEALEAKELEGKSELEKLRIQVQKATDTQKRVDAERAKERADFEAALKSEKDNGLNFRRQTMVQSALSAAGLDPKVEKFAVSGFLSEAQLELDEQHAIKSIVIGGKSFAKLDEAAKHFLTEVPNFAAPRNGGAGTPRNGNGAGNGQTGLEQHTSVESLLNAGLAARAQT